MKTVTVGSTIYEDHQGTLVPIGELNGKVPDWPAPNRAAY